MAGMERHRARRPCWEPLPAWRSAPNLTEADPLLVTTQSWPTGAFFRLQSSAGFPGPRWVF